MTNKIHLFIASFIQHTIFDINHKFHHSYISHEMVIFRTFSNWYNLIKKFRSGFRDGDRGAKIKFLVGGNKFSFQKRKINKQYGIAMACLSPIRCHFRITS